MIDQLPPERDSTLMRAEHQPPPKPSLRARVLRHVMVPLALTWFLGTVVALVTSNYFTKQAFDRSLLDDAYTVAANVRLRDGALELGLTMREVGTLLFDRNESSYFAVLSNGALIAGHAGLRAPPPPVTANYLFSDISYQGKNLRAVSLHREEPDEYDVVMAVTTTSRTRLLQRLLVYSVLPEIVLLLLLTGWLRRSIQNDLQPVTALQQAVDLRSASDLTPVPLQATTRDLERLGGAINGLMDRVALSVRAQREFAGNVAHELRTPLAGIRALADYGLAQSDPAVWREQLERIALSQARASHLVDQLLALALADEARTSLQREPVALDELARQVVLRHLAQADAAGVDLGARGLDDAVTLEAHHALVEGILDNLVDNAIRYGRPPAGGTASVTVELARLPAEGDLPARVALSVADEGPGISREQQAALRQRWAQGPDGQQLGQGAGLGMSIVVRYADLLGADFVLAPNPELAGERGLKASVVFRLPPAAGDGT